MSKPKVPGGKSNQSRAPHRVEFGQPVDRITAGTATQSESRPAINYIVGGPSDDQYQSKH